MDMEYFRYQIVTRITAVLLTVILQLDILDYLTTTHFSIPVQTITEQTIQDADDVQEESDDTNLSLQRSRTIQKNRRRGMVCQQYSISIPILHPLQNQSQADSINAIRLETCPLRTLFCVFRI